VSSIYNILKAVGKVILPERIRKRHEGFFRRIVSSKYRGDKYECNICKMKLSSWIIVHDGDQLCPRCGSLPRTRRLFSILQPELKENIKMLHFSPPTSLRNYINGLRGITYITTDYESEFEADKHYDITAIDVDDETFDLIVCYHVLEHIEDDMKAMSELHRILKPSGKLLIQTPFHDSPTLEDEKINTRALRLKHYGQEDHVRIYNAVELMDRLKSTGLQVNLNRYKTTNQNIHGYKIEDIVLECTK